MTRTPITVPALVFVAITGCAGAPASERDTTPVAATDPSEAQVARGGEVYAERCAGCHGASGEGGGRAPRLVGEGALPLEPPSPESARQVRFATAGDVLDWVSANMPPRGGSLPADDYAAVVAFALSANGVDLGGRTVSAESAATWTLHP